MAWGSDWAPGGKAGPTQGSSGACNASEWLEGEEPGCTPSQTWLKGWQWRQGCLAGDLKVSSFFFPFVSASMAACCIWAYPHLLQPGTLLPSCHCCVFHHVIVLQCYMWIFFLTQEGQLQDPTFCFSVAVHSSLFYWPYWQSLLRTVVLSV